MCIKAVVLRIFTLLFIHQSLVVRQVDIVTFLTAAERHKQAMTPGITAKDTKSH